MFFKQSGGGSGPAATVGVGSGIGGSVGGLSGAGGVGGVGGGATSIGTVVSGGTTVGSVQQQQVGTTGVDDEERRNKIKAGLKKTDDLKKVLEQLVAQCKKISAATRYHAENEKLFADVLYQFPQKDRELPVPHEVSEESGFVLGMQKFAEVFQDMHDLENKFGSDVEDFANKISLFILNYLDKNTGSLKTKIKNYEMNKAEYDKSLQKIQKIQKDSKKLSVVKLYEAHKERAKIQNSYEKAAEEMADHADDIDDNLNTKLLEDCINFYHQQKNLLGLTYGLLNDLKDYLTSIKEWCKEEAKSCDEHRTEREAHREQQQKDEYSFTKNQFALFFHCSQELIGIITRIGIEKAIDPSVMINSFMNLFKEAGLPLEGFSQLHKAIVTENKALIADVSKEPVDMRVFIKDNFDLIGMKVLEELKQKELLIHLGGLLSSLEQLTKS